MTGLYFHIPFCAKKCPYCDFYSVPYSKSTVQGYVDALLRNLHHYRQPELAVDTLYFGGGTPSLLTPEQVQNILSVAADCFDVQPDAEITLEYNPTRKPDGYLKTLRSIGVNRLSIGTQSFSDKQLQLLGRTHTATDNLRTVQAAQEAGFTNISCDLMLATPDQTENVLSETLEILTALPITHVSAYMLQIEDGTPLSQNEDLLARCPGDDATVERYFQAVHALRSAGFHQYEVSSFAKAGCESRHNLRYWKCEDYLGIGAGAHSCYAGKRFCVPRDARAFIAADVQPVEIVDAHPLDREERLMLALRLTEGVAEEMLSARARKKLPFLEQSDYLRRTPQGNIALTPQGFAVSNAVIAELIES
ncbi:MAG: radical SAM family heme chaperone HemW [Oscillospiraceae bacterium]|nr:radical SAM family heme chaperone HemW [Oscillospiraceae bacterium]